MSYKPPSTPTPIHLNPKNNNTTIQKAILLEAILNLFSFPLITHTEFILSFVLLDPKSHLVPSTILFARLFGGLIVGGLAPLLFLVYPNTKAAIESRRTAYLTLGLGEVVLIPILVNEALKGSGNGAALSVKACVGTIMCLAPPLMWRIWCLFVRPEMMGVYKEEKRA